MLTVRPMRARERDDVRALLTEAYLPYEKEMAPTVFTKYLASVLDIDENQTLVAVDGDTVLGSARGAAVGQGTGVARALMAHVASAARDATAVLLHTMDFMPAAIRLYERLGYRRAPEWDFRGGRAAATSESETFLAKACRLAVGRRC